jgi:hypothetical protein
MRFFQHGVLPSVTSVQVYHGLDSDFQRSSIVAQHTLSSWLQDSPHQPFEQSVTGADIRTGSNSNSVSRTRGQS